jgi:hypothetical protein
VTETRRPHRLCCQELGTIAIEPPEKQLQDAAVERFRSVLTKIRHHQRDNPATLYVRVEFEGVVVQVIASPDIEDITS